VSHASCRDRAGETERGSGYASSATFRTSGQGHCGLGRSSTCLERLGEGDTLIVWRLDRLGRNLRHLLSVLAELDERGITFRSLTEAIDTAAGQLQLHLFAALAEFERALGLERTRAGLQAARERGRVGGRPTVVTDRKLAAALAMREQGELTMSQIAEELSVSPASLYRRLARHRQETELGQVAAA
jgi:DNA invertase Pin-like site-specific DNA recombinase